MDDKEFLCVYQEKQFHTFREIERYASLLVKNKESKCQSVLPADIGTQKIASFMDKEEFPRVGK
jgi:hypothetical protein